MPEIHVVMVLDVHVLIIHEIGSAVIARTIKATGSALVDLKIKSAR